MSEYEQIKAKILARIENGDYERLQSQDFADENNQLIKQNKAFFPELDCFYEVYPKIPRRPPYLYGG